MKEEKIRVGDVVELVSGGPEMTVSTVRAGMDPGGLDTNEALCLIQAPAQQAPPEDIPF